MTRSLSSILRPALRLFTATVLVSFAVARSTATAQQGSVLGSSLPDSAQIGRLVQGVADEQALYLERSGNHFRYRLHRVDPKEDTLRDVIESAGGNLTRLLQHNGQELTLAENEGDLDRLTHYITSGDLRKKEKEDKRSHTFGLELIRAMPRAMVYTLTAGQPQLPHLDRPQLVFDFTPNADFHPATTAEGLLSGLSGRMWIDAADHHLVRLELNIARNLDLAMGILIRVYPGGTVAYDQRRVANDAYALSHVRIHVRLRELMVKTVPYDSDLVATDIELLAPVPTPEEAQQTLLKEEVKTR